MKKLIAAVLILSCLTVKAQVESSENGYTLPVHDTIRVLTVFAQVDYSPCGISDPMGGNADWPTADSNNCTNPLDCAPPVFADDIFDVDMPATGPTPNSLTDYYYQASLGNYIVLGDYVAIKIPCTSSSLPSNRVKPVTDYLNTFSTITTAHGKRLSDFDLINGTSKGLLKPRGTDSIIDVLVIVWKNDTVQFNKTCAGGNGVSSYSYEIQNNTYDIKLASPWQTCSFDGFFYTFTAEYLHGMFGHNNWHTTGGAGPYSFLTPPRFWGTTAQYDGINNSWCGYDQFHLGWQNDQKQYLLSALDTLDQEVDFSDYSISNNPEGGTYVLRSFEKTGDAIRIKLPHINWQQNGDVKNQYLWLENRQMLSDYEDRHFETEASTPLLTGMYAYIQVGKDRKTGTSPNDDIFAYNSNYADPNNLGNWLMPLTAEGNYDFTYRFDLVNYCYGSSNTLPYEKSASKPNALTGFSTLYMVAQSDTNPTEFSNLLLGKSEVIDDTFTCDLDGYGNSYQAFRLGGNNKLALYTNPAPVPVYTYRSNDYATYYPDSIPSWENRTIRLNGLSITIIDSIPDATVGGYDLKVKIKWDDYDIRQDVRWCGNIVLQNDTADPYSRQSQIVIDSGKTVSLERGHSPTQHVVNDTFEGQPLFTKPTNLTLKSRTKTHLKENSTLHIKDDSKLILEEEAEMLLEDGACVVVDSMATFQLNGNNITLNGDDATIVVKTGGTIRTADGVDLTFMGDGYLQFYEDAIVDLGTGSEFSITGPGKYHRIIQLHQGAQIDIGQHNYDIVSGKIEVGPSAWLANDSAKGYFLNASFNGNNGSDEVNGWAAYIGNNPTYFYMGNTDLDSLTNGVTLKNADSLKNKHYTFSNCDFSEIGNIAITLENVKRKVSVGNTTITGSSGYKGISADSVKILDLVHTSISGFTYGMKVRQTPAVYLSGANTDIEYNTTGLQIDTCNVFIRNNATIANNYTGISMKGDSSANDTDPEGYLLTVGDLGCGNIINNTVGVDAQDVVLNIDAEINACARGDCNDLAPNRFDGNGEIFDICNQYFYWDTVFAKYNYWDNGQGADPTKYALKEGGLCKIGAILLDDNYLTTQPTNCNNAGDDVDETMADVLSIGMKTRCDRTLSGSSDSLVGGYGGGYHYFLQKDWSSAETYLGQVAAESLDDTTYADGCRQCMYVSRALVHVAKVHQGYDSTYTESGKRSLKDEKSEGVDEFISLYPNPTEGNLTIRNGYKSTCMAEIRSISGVKIRQETVYRGVNKIDINDLENGVYIIYTYSLDGKEISNAKVVKM